MVTATTRWTILGARLKAIALSPIALGLPCAALFVAPELRQYASTAVLRREMIWGDLFGELVGALFVLQLVLLAAKWRREPSFVRVLPILTPRGLAFLILASLVIFCPYEHNDELEAMAVAACAVLDVFVTLAIGVSLSAQVTRDRERATAADASDAGDAPKHPSRRLAPTAFLRRGSAATPRANVARELSPPIADAGDAVEERFAVGGLSIPFGFRLRVEQDLPKRLGGPTRLSLDGPARADSVLQAPLPETRRGLYDLPAPDVWYEDLLGFTRVAVAGGAPTELRILPRLRPVTLLPRMPPNAGAQIVPLTKAPPTEDLFTVREYRPGDDARRVHWRHSVNLGVLHVRVPETKPASPRRVRLVLDTYLPATHDETDATHARLLDAMIEGWTSLARALVRNGDRVTLTAAMRDAETGAVTVRDIDARPGSERQWRAFAAELAWQSERLADDALAHGPANDRKRTNLVVSGGFQPPGARSLAGGALVLARLPPAEDDDADPRSALARFVFSTYPVGADDNAGDASLGIFRPRSRARANVTNTYIWARDWAKKEGIPVVSMEQAAGAITFVTEAAS